MTQIFQENSQFIHRTQIRLFHVWVIFTKSMVIESLLHGLEYTCEDFCEALIALHAFTGCDIVELIFLNRDIKTFKDTDVSGTVCMFLEPLVSHGVWVKY